MAPELLHFIDGREQASCSGERFLKTDPARGQAIWQVHAGSQAEIDAAVAAAQGLCAAHGVS
jgi:Aldehyde dehydrogenase family.